MTKQELIRLLRTAESPYDVCAYHKELADVMPSISKMFCFDQRSKYHGYDLFTHCCATVALLPKDLKSDMVYLAALIHDIGKVEAHILLDNGIASYKGHQEHSYAETISSIIPELSTAGINLSSDEQDQLLFFVRHHDDDFKSMQYNLKPYRNLPKFWLLAWCNLEIADAMAHTMYFKTQERIRTCNVMLNLVLKNKY